MGMSDREKVTEWLEFDYLPRVGAYRKDCKIGCDACMPKHNDDNYCDIDMLGKILVLLKEQESAEPEPTEHIVFGTNRKCSNCGKYLFPACEFCPHCGRSVKWE